MGCCSSLPDSSYNVESNFANISVVDSTNLNRLAREQEPISIQGNNPLTFQDVTLSDTSSDIDEALIAEMTKSDSDNIVVPGSNSTDDSSSD